MYADEWQKKREKGLALFVRKEGVVFGLLIFAVNLSIAMSRDAVTAMLLLEFLAISAACSVVWGCGTWFLNNKLYRSKK